MHNIEFSFNFTHLLNDENGEKPEPKEKLSHWVIRYDPQLLEDVFHLLLDIREQVQKTGCQEDPGRKAVEEAHHSLPPLPTPLLLWRRPAGTLTEQEHRQHCHQERHGEKDH